MTTPILKTQFQGITAASVDGNPPNCTIAVGPDKVLTSTVWRVLLSDKTGRQLDVMSGRDFFQSSGDHFDPRCLHNPILGEYVCAGNLPEGFAMCFASDPISLEGWQKLLLLGKHDFPTAGYNASGYLVTMGSAGNTAFWVANDRSRIMPLSLPSEFALGGSCAVSQMPDAKPDGPIWIARVKDSDKNKLRMMRIDAIVSVVPMAVANGQLFDVPIMQLYTYNNARQPGGQPFIPGTPNGDMIARTVNGRTYLYFTCQAGNPQHCCAVYWCVMDVTTGTPVMFQEGMFNGLDFDCWNPSISANKNGVAAINFNTSYPVGQLPAMLVGCKALADPDFTLATAAVSTDPLKGGRAGDYSTIACDPVDCSFWAVNELASNATGSSNYNWKSVVQQYDSNAPVPPSEMPFTGTIEADGKTWKLKGTMVQQ